MTTRSIAILKTITTKQAIVFLIIAIPYSVQAAPADMGSITIVSRNLANGTASGTYTAAGSGATGSFTLVRNETRGYESNVTITPTGNTGTNGIEIRNIANTNNDRDRFRYTFTITPDDNASIHTIKIGQASYAQGGNSEIARHTLAFTANTQNNIPTQATIKDNPSVPYYYNAMGDYFMGTRLNATQLNSQNGVSAPQLRVNSSNAGGSGLYYYNIPSLTGANSSQNPYSPTLINNQVSLSSTNGVLPPMPTFNNIIKSINNGSSYSALSSGTTIANGGTYVSYGIENTQSNYVVAVRNANAVTLTYDAIMNGNIGIVGPVIGETFNEWISFGVESAPLYFFSGTIFNDNGGIDDNNANVNTSNATINSGIYSSTQYFNGIFNSTESGITGSTVRLVNDCANPTIEYASQTLTSTDANQIGRYGFTVLQSVIGNRSSVCIIETRSNTDYSIRTTTDKRLIALTTNNYNYPNNNFGRVIAGNAALVLEKEQAANDCNITSLTDPTLSYSKQPLSSSATGTGSDIRPGQCIAYKIIATNRANLDISNFVMQDVLQETGMNGATVTSKLANPVNSTNDYANDSVAIGNNGTVKTNTFNLNQRTKRNFYFNTKYGSTQSN